MKMYLKNVFVALLASLLCDIISCAVTREASDLLENDHNYQVCILYHIYQVNSFCHIYSFKLVSYGESEYLHACVICYQGRKQT